MFQKGHQAKIYRACKVLLTDATEGKDHQQSRRVKQQCKHKATVVMPASLSELHNCLPCESKSVHIDVVPPVLYIQTHVAMQYCELWTRMSVLLALNFRHAISCFGAHSHIS